MAKKVVTDFGSVLKQLRENRGWTREELSKKIKRTAASIAAIELGKASLPSEPQLREWLKRLGCIDNLKSLIELSRTFQLSQTIRLQPKETCNPDIIRLLQTYRYGTITDYDRALLSLLCRDNE